MWSEGVRVFHPSVIYTGAEQEWIMPQCNNCKGFVTDAYVRVFAPLGCPLFVSARATRTWFERELTCVKRTLPGAEIVQTRSQ